jgi:hypothetical protein
VIYFNFDLAAYDLIVIAGAASEAAAERDRAMRRAWELDEKLKAQEDRHKVALESAETKVHDLQAQAAERDDLLVDHLRAMVEDLTGMTFESFISYDSLCTFSAPSVEALHLVLQACLEIP